MRVPFGLPTPVPGPLDVDPYGDYGDDPLPEVQAAALEKFRAEAPAAYERLIAVDGDGNCLLDKSGEKHQIAFDENDVAKMRSGKNVVVMHNHPAGKTFSRGDLQHGGIVGPSRMIVVGLGNTYQLSPGASGWPSQQEAFDGYNKTREVAMKQLRKKYGYNEDYSRGKAKDDLDALTLELVAKERGLRYRRKVR